MFKKIIITLAVLSPLLWILIIGYPVKNNQRQYQTDDFVGYIHALSQQPKLNDLMLIKTISQKVGQLLF